MRAGQSRCPQHCRQRRGQVLIRPEQIRLHDSTHRFGVDARVHEVSFYGHDASVRLDLLPDGPRVTARISGDKLPSPGTPVRLTVTGDTLAYSSQDTQAEVPTQRAAKPTPAVHSSARPI